MWIKDIVDFVKVFFKQDYRIVSGAWVMTNCPFSLRTHLDGDDKRYSFGIHINNGFNCFTCGQKGHVLKIPYLLRRYDLIDEEVFYEMKEFLEVAVKVRSGSVDRYLQSKEILKKECEVSEEELRLFPYLDVESKFNKILGFTVNDILKWEIRWDVYRNVVMFPIRDREGRLVGIKYRGMRKDGSRFFYSVGIRKNVWYGEHLLSDDRKLFLVEGERDAIFLKRYVKNVVASLGTFSIEQLRMLPKKKWVILFWDADKQGRELLKKFVRYCVSEVEAERVYAVVDYERWGKDPQEVVAKGCLLEVLKKCLIRIF